MNKDNNNNTARPSYFYQNILYILESDTYNFFKPFSY